MTWFGIALVVYYVLSLLLTAAYIGRGEGFYTTPASLAVTMLIQGLILILLLTVGVNI